MNRRQLSEPLSIGITVLLFAACFGAWEVLSRVGVLPRFFFPPPSVIAVTLKELLTSGQLTIHLKATLGRLFLGFLIGGLPGYILGMWMGWSYRVRRILDPFVAALHPVPKISMLPIIMIIFGIGIVSRTFVVSLACFFPMLINTMSGVRQIHPLYFEVAQNYGAGSFQIFRKVVAPGSLPFVLAGARLGLNVALSLTIAVELVAAKEGLGTMIWLAWQTFRIEELYAGVVLAALIGIGIRLIVQYLTRRLVPWQLENNR